MKMLHKERWPSGNFQDKFNLIWLLLNGLICLIGIIYRAIGLSFHLKSIGKPIGFYYNDALVA